MSVAKRQTASLDPIQTLILWINRGIEFLWLAAVVLVPLAFFGREFAEWSSVIGSYELPKITLLRTLAGLLSVLWLTKWAFRGGFAGIPSGLVSGLSSPRSWLPGLAKWLGGQPARWVILAISIYVAATALSAILSVSSRVSIWGDVPGQDSYSAYTVAAYMVLFGAIATHLRTRDQFVRLLGAVVVMGLLLSLYAISQHYGHDFLDLMEPPTANRVSSTMGNPIFAASVISMTTPATLIAAAMSLTDPLKTRRFWGKLAMWALVLAAQISGLIFTESRGPWFGTILAIGGFLGFALAFLNRTVLVRAGAVLALAAVVTVAVVAAPFDPTQREAAPAPRVFGERIASIPSATSGGGLSARFDLWKSSWQLISDHPWFEFDGLNLSFLRPVIGYGPDLFRTAHLLESPPNPAQWLLPGEPVHAHNYFVHQGVELGILGALASLAIFGSIFLAGRRVLLRGGQEFENIEKLLIVGLLAIFAGRLLEQLVGVARVSDLTIYWVLVGAFVAFARGNRDSEGQRDPGLGPTQQPASRHSRGRPASSITAVAWRPVLRGGIVIGLAVGIGALTWLKTIDYSRAAMIVDEGAAQYRSGEPSAALSSLQRALGITPDVSSYYDQVTFLYNESRANGPESNPFTAECGAIGPSSSIELCSAERVHEINLRWLEERPISFRSRLALANSALELGILKDEVTLRDQAIRLYREATQMVPNSWALWNRLAGVHLQLGQPEPALAALQKSMAITRNTGYSIQVALLQSEAYRMLDQPRDAINILSGAVPLTPEDDRIYYNRGTTYFELGLLQLALEDMDQVIRINSKHSNAYYVRGIINNAIGQPQRAIEDYDEAIRLDQFFSLAYNNRGLVYAGLGELESAREDFDRAILTDNEFALAYNNRGFVNKDIGNLEQAIDDLDRAIALDPELAMAYYNRALSHALLGDDEQAQSDGRRAVELGIDAESLNSAIANIRGQR